MKYTFLKTVITVYSGAIMTTGESRELGSYPLFK